MTSVIPKASTATPDPRAQRAAEPTALYRLLDASDTLLYVGVTSDPERRFKQHRDSKVWWPQVARKTVEWRPSRAVALAEEAAAIEAETPVYNIDHNPVAPSYHWPPAGMPADRVEAIEREASTLPADQAEGIRRAAFDGFMRTQRIRTASLDQLVATLPEAVDEAMRKAIPHWYTPELATQIAETATGIITGSLCPVWPTLCTDTTPGHYDHFNHDHKVTDKRGQTLLDVTFVQFTDDEADGPATISLGGLNSEDYTPEEIRQVTAEIRRLLDTADEMADQVMRMQGKDVPTAQSNGFNAATRLIDAAFKASKDTRLTRDALRTYVDMTFNEVGA